MRMESIDSRRDVTRRTGVWNREPMRRDANGAVPGRKNLTPPSPALAVAHHTTVASTEQHLSIERRDVVNSK